MAKITSLVSLFDTEAASRANSGYAFPSYTMPWTYTAANYDGTVTVYFEVVASSSAGTASVELFDSSNTSIVVNTTTSTTPVRVRSADIFSSLVDGRTFRIRLKSTGAGDTATLYAARLIITQNGTITKTETVFTFGSSDTTSNTSYEDDGFKLQYYYDSSKFDGTIAMYFEAMVSNQTAGQIGYAQLSDAAGNAVASSEVTNNTTTDTAVRSAAISLTTATAYKVQIKAQSSTARCRVARLIIVQTATPTLTEKYFIIKNCWKTFTNTQEATSSFIYWDDDEWSISSKVTLFEAWMTASSGDTASCDLNDGSTDLDTRTVTATSITRNTSGDLESTLADNSTLDAQIRNSDASQSVFHGAYLRVQATITSGATNVTANADVVTGTLSLPSPTVTGIQNVSVTADVVSLTASLPSPTVTGVTNISVSADVVSLTATLPTPTVTVIQNVSVTPDPVVLTGSLPSPTITTIRNESVSADVVTGTLSLPAPTVTAVQNVSTTADVVTLTASLPTPTVTGIQSVSTTADVVSGVLSLPAPTVTTVQNVSVTADVVTLTASLPAPTVVTAGDIEVSADVVSGTLSLPAPTVTAVQNISTTADVITGTLSLPAPTVSTTQNVSTTADVVTGTLSLPAPSITTTQNVTVAADVISLTASLPAPTITTVRHVSVSADVITVTASLPSPTVTTGEAATASKSIIYIDGNFAKRISDFYYITI